jgi:hypothetical protein
MPVYADHPLAAAAATFAMQGAAVALDYTDVLGQDYIVEHPAMEVVKVAAKDKTDLRQSVAK